MAFFFCLAACSGGGNGGGGSTTTSTSQQATAAPQITTIPPTAALVGKTLTYDVDAIDPDSPTLMYALTTAPTGMTIVPATGVITWTPLSNQVGAQPVTVTVSDGLNTSTQTFVVSVFGIQKEVASVTITAVSGGTVTVNDPNSKINGLTIVIPPNALPADTTIKVLELTIPAPIGGGQPFPLQAFSIEPDGTVLSSPATLSLPFDPATLNAVGGIVLPEFLGFFFLDPKTGKESLQDGFTADPIQNVLVGTINHFSEWIEKPIARLCAPPTDQVIDCSDTYVDSKSKYASVLLVHGFIANPLWNKSNTVIGDESTWGNLRKLLKEKRLITGSIFSDPIEAWRFDYDSSDTSFRVSARNLFMAISRIRHDVGRFPVNIVAHSFGGILARTYIQGRGSADGTEGGADIPYTSWVNKLLTLGTPQAGIGPTYSVTFLTNLCFDVSAHAKTCDEAGGTFLSDLNKKSLPPLASSLDPQYMVIIGRRFENGDPVQKLWPDDGLITTQGADICAAVPTACQDSRLVTKTIASKQGESAALCHSKALAKFPGNIFACGTGVNVPMAEVTDENHRMWPIIVDFLTLGSNKGSPEPMPTSFTLKVKKIGQGTVLGRGKITSDPLPIDCGSTCEHDFPSDDLVTLSPKAETGFVFTGWSAPCGKTWTCPVTMHQARQITATFSPKASDGGGTGGSGGSIPVGTWSTTGNMSSGRLGHTATLLSNGGVLAAGGVGTLSLAVVASAEIYNSSAGTWQSTQPMTSPRVFHTATALQTGEVLVAGGEGNSILNPGSLNSAELYNPASGLWTATGSMTVVHRRHTATRLLSGRVIAVAGTAELSGVTMATAEIYDPGTHQWTLVGNLGTPRGDQAAVLLSNGKVLVSGGTDSQGNTLASAEIFDPNTGAWSPTAPMKSSRSQFSLTLLKNGMVLAAGGTILTSLTPFRVEALASAELYNPSTGQWNETTSMQFPKSTHTATLLTNGMVLVAGGGQPVAELYDPSTSHWFPTPPINFTWGGFSTATLLLNGKVLLAGGQFPGTTSTSASSELYTFPGPPQPGFGEVMP